MTKEHGSTASRLLAVASCLSLAVACSVPGSYNVKGLNKSPEATRTYPGSSNVMYRHSNGRVKWFLGRGDPASVYVTATTTATPTQVIAYFSQTLTTTGWKQNQDIPDALYTPAAPTHIVAWTKAKLVFELAVRIDPTTRTTRYDSTLAGTI